MPTMGPQDVQGIMEMLDAVQRAEAAGKLPPGSYDQRLQQLESEYEYNLPQGQRGEQGFSGRIGNPDPVRAPYRGEHDRSGNFERRQTMADSMANDAMLGRLLGYKRKREEGEPEGSMVLANYPGAEMDIARVEQGYGSWGHAANFMDSQERMALQEKAKKWGQYQRELHGTDTESPRDFRGRRSAERGLSGRDRMRYMMRGR